MKKLDTSKAIIIKFFMFTTSLVGLALITAFQPIYGNIPLIIIPGILVIVFAKPVFFEKMKLTTLLTLRILVVFASLRILDPKYYVDIVLVMLIVNIAEATYTDIFKYKRYLNGISGIAVGLGVLCLKGVWMLDAPYGDYYLITGLSSTISLMYIIAYTIWNWIFVTNEFSDSVSLMHIGFLATPIIGSLLTLPMGIYGGLGLWLVLRANSLSIGGWLQIGAKEWFEEQFVSEKFSKFVAFTKTNNMQILFMLINVILVVLMFVLTIQQGGNIGLNLSFLG